MSRGAPMPSYAKKIPVPGKSSTELYEKVSSSVDRFVEKSNMPGCEIQRDAAAHSVTLKHSMVTATVRCTDGTIEVDAKLSFLAAPFKSKIDEGIQVADQDVRAGLKPAAASAGSSVLRAVGAMGVATFFSRILVAREQVFAVLFGAGNMTDAFIVAFRIPNLLRDLFAEGAMSASLVPTFTAPATRRESAGRGGSLAWFSGSCRVVSVLAVLGIIFAPELVGLYASAFKLIPGKFELTVQMTRIIFPFFPLVALAAAFMGVLNACGFFPARVRFSPFQRLFDPDRRDRSEGDRASLPGAGVHPIEGMAVGVVAGGVVQAFCQLPSLYRAGYRWSARRRRNRLGGGTRRFGGCFG